MNIPNPLKKLSTYSQHFQIPFLSYFSTILTVVQSFDCGYPPPSIDNKKECYIYF